MNPVAAVKSADQLVNFMNSNHWSGQAAAKAGEGMLNGTEFWNQSDPYKAGEALMTDLLIASPAIKKIPNISAIGLGDIMLTPKTGPITGATLFRLSVGGNQVLRTDIGRLDETNTMPKDLVGKIRPHVHRRGPGGIGKQWPWDPATRGK